MTMDPGTLGQELLGAELLASRQLTETGGTLWNGLEHLAQIQRQQLTWAVEDHVRFWGEVLNGASPVVAGRGLLEQRCNHLSRGWQDLLGTAAAGRDALAQPWHSFFDVVREDWRAPGTKQGP